MAAGTTTADDFPVTSDAVQASRRGGADLFFTRLDAAGTPVYASYFGGRADDEASAIAVRADGAVVLAGVTQSSETAGLIGHRARPHRLYEHPPDSATELHAIGPVFPQWTVGLKPSAG